MVFCLVLGDETETAFPVKLPSDKKVGELRELITKINPISFTDIDAKDLTLWQVSISDDDVKRMEILNDRPPCDIDIEELGGKVMSSRKDIKFYFPIDPVDESIHIIIVATTIRDAINIALKGAITTIDIVNPNDNMPFMERDTDKAISRIVSNIENNLKSSKSKTDFDILVSGGAPGIGKTRYGDELFKHLESNQSWVPSVWKNNLHLESLYIDFGNDCQLDSYDDELTPTVIIGLRIAYMFFIGKKYDMKFITFRDRVWKYRNTFKIPNVFGYIYKHLNLQQNRQLFVFLHIDEFQLVDRWEFDVVNKRKMPVKELFKEMINGLAPFMLGPPSNIFVQTFLSGTAPQVVISAKESSRVSFGFVNCPQLSLRAMLEIANHYAQKFDAEKYDYGVYKWMLCRPFLQLLEDTGGLPRALQYVFEQCFKIDGDGKKFFYNIYQQHFNTIFYNVKHHLQERYNIYEAIEKNKKLALEILYHSIDAIPVSRKTCLVPSDQDCTIENLERDTHIILNPCNATSSEFIIKTPFFFICIYNDKLQIVNRELEEVFRVQNEMYWQSWEIFVANYDAFRTNLLIKRGKKSARLNELYRGVHGTQSTLDIEVKLKELPVCYAKEQFPCVKLTDKGSNSIPWVKGENVIVNGASSAWGDALVVRELVQNNNKYILILYQCKYYPSGTYYTTNSLRKEHIKNLQSSIDTTGELRKIFSQCQHITIVFTIQPFDDTISTDNCLVITKNNFKEYFGPIFASRATFSMVKDINPNFSDCSWMKNDLPEVEVTADNIVKTRPHLSEDDFYKKFDRVKRAIENYEEDNPEKKVKLDFYPFNV